MIQRGLKWISTTTDSCQADTADQRIKDSEQPFGELGAVGSAAAKSRIKLRGRRWYE